MQKLSVRQWRVAVTREAHYLLITRECQVVTRLARARGGKVSRKRRKKNAGKKSITKGLNLKITKNGSNF